MTPSERQALRELCEAATPGPWRHRVGADNDDNIWECVEDQEGLFVEDISANCRFIAAARTALPALLDRVEVLEDMLRAYERALAEMSVTP